MTENALDTLKRHAWPGNVRELQHVIERGVALATGPEIDVADLPDNLGQASSRGATQTSDKLYMPFKEAKEALVEEFERAYIDHLLESHKGNVSRAAEASGIHRRSLHRLLVKHEMDASTYSKRN